MNIIEYNKVKGYNYEDYVSYLLTKYGKVGGDYYFEDFSVNSSIKRRDEELFIHHIREDKVANLSDKQIAQSSSYEYQKAENLCYANLLEHILLHIMIGEKNEGLGFGGAELMFTQANDFYNSFDSERESVLADGEEVLELLKERCRNSEEACDVLFQHNTTVFAEIVDTLDKYDRALAVIGTGLGKTTTALAYLKRIGKRGLVLGPKRIITDAWAKNEEVDAYTYQWFMYNYQAIDFSQYGILICDEAHHCAAERWGEGIRYVLDNGIIKVLGLTATPKEEKDKKNNETSAKFFNDHVCQGFTVLDGIERELIHDFSYVGAIYDTSSIREQYANIKDEKLLGELDLALNNTPTVEEIFRRHLPASKRKGIVFCSNIEAIDEAEDIMRKVLPNAEFRRMHSLMGAEALEVRKWFENTDEGWLFAVNMISEGAHYKGVNTIVMFRRTQSSLVFNQQLGRIITLTKDEDPEAIVFDLVNNANNIDLKKSFGGSLKEAYRIRKEKGGKKKSEQIIVEDYAEKISEILREIAEYNRWFWSDEEKEILTNYYKAHEDESRIDLTDLLTLLPRYSKTQIINQAAFLGISNNKRKPWTEEEDAIIIQYYPSLGIKIQEKLPDRTTTAIIGRASKLQIKYENNYYSEEEKQIIRDYYPTEGIKGVSLRLPDRPIKSIQAMANRLGIVMDNPNQNKIGVGHTAVMFLEQKKIFPSVAEASRETGDSRGDICNCCQGNRYSVHRHHYLYADDPRCADPEQAIKDIENQKKKKNPHNIAVRCKTTGEIFISQVEAKKKYPNASKISMCLKGERQTAGSLPDGTKLEWEYYTEGGEE